MKRLIALMLCLVLALSLAACGKKEDSPSSAAGAAQAATVQRENGQVMFTMSKNMLDIVGMKADDIVSSVQNSDQITKNDDGSLTYKMTEEEYDQVLASLKKTLDDSIEAFKTDETLSCIKEITYNDDISEIVISVDQETYKNNASAIMVGPTLGIYGGMMYQMYSGIPDESIKCSVVVKDASTGEEIQSMVYPDALEQASSQAATSTAS